METRQIQQNEWQKFFDSFNSKHNGARVDIEVMGNEIGAQTESTGLKLEGITAEWNEMSGNRISIMLGDSADDHITHSISQPTQVSLERSDEDVDVALAINGIDGTTALLRFQ